MEATHHLRKSEMTVDQLYFDFANLFARLNEVFEIKTIKPIQTTGQTLYLEGII
jgi:hypothetical protein